MSLLPTSPDQKTCFWKQEACRARAASLAHCPQMALETRQSLWPLLQVSPTEWDRGFFLGSHSHSSLSSSFREREKGGGKEGEEDRNKETFFFQTSAWAKESVPWFLLPPQGKCITTSLPSHRLPTFCSWLTPSLQTPLGNFFSTAAFPSILSS